MTRFVLASAAVLALSSLAAHAQMPTDNDAWKARCAMLSSLDHNGVLPASLVSLTHGVSGAKFTTFGFDRDAAGEHNVACTFFYLGAVAEQAAHHDSAAQNDAVLGRLQVKQMKGQSATISESFARMKAKAAEITHPALTEADEQHVMDAATTIPFTAALDAKTNSLVAANLHERR